MHAVVWSDYLCPWCYLGQDRTALLRSLGVSVTVLPYELHPDVPVGGRPLAVRYSRVAAECAEIGMPFAAPGFVPNTRYALSVAEWVRRCAPDRFDALHAAVFRAYFVEGLDIGDSEVVASLAGVDADVRAGSEWVDESMAAARESDVFATPAWRLDTGAVIPGVQPRAFYERVVAKSQEATKKP